MDSLPPVPLPRAIEAALDAELSTETFVSGRPDGELRIGMVMKRTYTVGRDGRCEPAPREQQELVAPFLVAYDVLDAPEVSPVLFDDDTLAFRQATDLVVQGHAHSYGNVIDRTTVAARLGDYRREINVYGERRAEWTPEGAVRFTTPEPFERLPIRYDRAYGGFDRTALERWKDPEYAALEKANPDLGLDRSTPMHYGRNPCGRGFLVDGGEQSVAAVQVPNLEFPFDPVTPERLAVGGAEAWLEAPLPACMDWVHPTWFPRCAYLGISGVLPGRRGDPVREVELGWAPPGLLDTPPLLTQQGPLPAGFMQAASPGMSFPGFDPGQDLELLNLHPEQPTWHVHLPGEVPDLRLQLTPLGPTQLVPHLNAVVVRPDLDEVVMVWCASAPSEREFTLDQAADLPRELHWIRRGRGA